MTGSEERFRSISGAFGVVVTITLPSGGTVVLEGDPLSPAAIAEALRLLADGVDP